MGRRFLYSALCILHMILFLQAVSSFWIAGLIGLIISIYTYKYVILDETWSIQLLLMGVYIFSEPSIAYIFVFFSSIVLFLYCVKDSKTKNMISEKIAATDVEQDKFNQTFQTLRKERHDYLKHITAIHYLLEKQTSKEAKEYMEVLIDGYEETNLSIKGEHGAVAAILHSIYKRAHDANITLNYHFDLPCSKLPLPTPKVVALVGNILENALDACEEWQQQSGMQGYIEMTLQKRSGLYILTCKNSTLPLSPHIADQLFQTVGITTKSSHDGLGTSIIQNIIKEQQGYLDFLNEKETFTLTCKIPSIQ